MLRRISEAISVDVPLSGEKKMFEVDGNRMYSGLTNLDLYRTASCVYVVSIIVGVGNHTKSSLRYVLYVDEICALKIQRLCINPLKLYWSTVELVLLSLAPIVIALTVMVLSEDVLAFTPISTLSTYKDAPPAGPEIAITWYHLSGTIFVVVAILKRVVPTLRNRNVSLFVLETYTIHSVLDTFLLEKLRMDWLYPASVMLKKTETLIFVSA